MAIMQWGVFLKDVINFAKSFYLARVISVVVLYEKYTCLCDTTWLATLVPTAVPVLAVPSQKRIKVPNSARTQISKQYFAINWNSATLFPTFVVIYYPVTTCPLRGLLFCWGQQKTNKRNLDFVEEVTKSISLECSM